MKNTARLTCPLCKAKELRRTLESFETKTDGRTFVVPDVEMERCGACLELFITPDGSKRISAYLAEATGALAIEELEAFLKRYQLTQKGAAEILGVGEKNFSRWLNGRQRVSGSMSNYIRTLTAHPEAFETLRLRNWEAA